MGLKMRRQQKSNFSPQGALAGCDEEAGADALRPNVEMWKCVSIPQLEAQEMVSLQTRQPGQNFVPKLISFRIKC
jgi:hypothetical protein